MNFENAVISAPLETERKKETEPVSYEQIIQKIVGNGAEVKLWNADQFREGGSRFLYGFVDIPGSEKKGFIKLTRVDTDKKYQEQLERESGVMSGVEPLNVPTVKQIVPYQETRDGYALVCFEKLDLASGELLSNPEFTAMAPPEYGEWAAQAIGSASGKELAIDADTHLFKKSDGRNESPETFWKVWEEAKKRTVALPEEEQKLLDSEGVESLRKIMDNTRAEMEALLESAQETGKQYFVHNDASPNNAFFNTEEQKALLLDFEHGGVTSNKLLALLTDIGNFYGRTWANSEMQEKFLLSLMDNEEILKDVELRQKLVRMAAVFGATYLAKYAMNPKNGEHLMAKSLLKNLPGHLEALEKHVQTTKQAETV